MMLAKKLAIPALLLMAGAAPRLAADEPLPKAETILDKYIEVTGGKAAYQKLHSAISTGSLEVVGKGIKGMITSYRSEPDKSYSVTEIEGIGKIEEGSDGKVAWERSAIQGPRIKQGAERSLAILLGSFNLELHWRDLFKKAEVTGVENVNGQDCYKVVLTPNEGDPITQFFDKKTNLPVKMLVTIKNPMGEIPVETFLGDYHKDGEFLSAHKLQQKAAGQEILTVIDSIKYNAEIPKGRFDLPDEIKALLKK